MRKTLTQEEFISRCIAIHGNKYDYSETLYTKNIDKVHIICKIHGKFSQIASDHMGGVGCRLCGINSQKSVMSYTLDKFISKAIKVHGCGKYIYDKVKYIHSKVHVDIECKKHGIFRQTPSGHLSGKGCKECCYEQRSKIKTKSTDHHLKKAKVVHSDKYKYDLVKFVNCDKKVIIVCPKHGEFPQTLSNHNKGVGCPKCAKENAGTNWRRSTFTKGCKNNIAVFYVLKIENGFDECFIKLGITKTDVKHRYAGKSKSIGKYDIIHEVKTDPDTVFNLEKLNLKLLKPYKYTPKNKFQGHTECFTIEALPHILTELPQK